MNLYKDHTITYTTQVTGIATRNKSRTPTFRQSVSSLIPPNKQLTETQVSIKTGEPFTISNIEHFLQLRCNFNVNLTLRKNGAEIPMGIKQIFIFHGSLDGEIEVSVESDEYVPINVVFA